MCRCATARATGNGQHGHIFWILDRLARVSTLVVTVSLRTKRKERYTRPAVAVGPVLDVMVELLGRLLHPLPDTVGYSTGVPC